MKRAWLFLYLFLMSSHSWAAREVQNGGGGWVQQGEYMTFYSARIPVEPVPLAMAEIPGLGYLLKKVSSLKISEISRARILEQLFPLGGRAYYKVDAHQFDDQRKKELIEKYAAVTGVSSENLALFAATDSESQGTFLLPEFYKLKEVEQAAILLHEAAWILKSDISYPRVLVLEQAAQAFFEDELKAQNIQKFYQEISGLLQDHRIPLMASFQFDVRSGFLGSRVYLQELFGGQYLACLTAPHRAVTDIVYRSKECAQSLKAHIFDLSLAHPSSLFLSSLLNYLKNEGSLLWMGTQPFANLSEGIFTQDGWSERNGALVLKIRNKSGLEIGSFHFL